MVRLARTLTGPSRIAVSRVHSVEAGPAEQGMAYPTFENVTSANRLLVTTSRNIGLCD